MADRENHFTVLIRLPFKRAEFVDPPPVAWSATKERELWDVISRQSKGNEIDWNSLAEQFQVTEQFLLQQAAWLYERQLSQVRAQMRRMGNRSSATASPAPSSAAASIMGNQPSKRPSGPVSRGPSRLSTQIPTTAAPADSSVPNTPARSRTSLPLKPATPGSAGSNTRAQPPLSRPLSRKPSKDNEPSSRTHSRRGSIQQQLSKSPAEDSSSSEDETTVKHSHRRPNSASTQRRTSSVRKLQHVKTSSLGAHQLEEQREEDEDEDDPAFLPFANTSSKTEQSITSPTDPSATLRGTLNQPPTATASTSSRPVLQRNHTSERIRPSSTTITTAKQKEPQSQLQSQPLHQLTSSASSLSSNNSPFPSTTIPSSAHPPRHTSAPPISSNQPSSQPAPRSLANALAQNSNPPPTTATTLPTPLSPLQQAALATAAGLSPRRRSTNPHQPQRSTSHTHTGSESSPSMGSSFSDLDDASVTQSALEEALMSNMNALGSTAGVGGLGSRVSGISQALRSRYFDARSGPQGGNGVGEGR